MSYSRSRSMLKAVCSRRKKARWSIWKNVLCIGYINYYAGRILASIDDKKVCEGRIGSLQEEPSKINGIQGVDSQPKCGHAASHFLPTSRRIVQFSNGKVYWIVFLSCLTTRVNFVNLLSFRCLNLLISIFLC